MKNDKIKVVFFYRKPATDNFSIEKLFDTVRKWLPKNVDDVVYKPKYVSKGIWPRLFSAIEVAFHQGDVNHITGDVHYLTYFMKKKKTVLSIMDCVFMRAEISNLSKAIIRTFWYRIPIKRVAYITTISESSKADILSFIKYDPDKIFVVPVPLPPGYKHAPKKFNSSKPVILQIGTAHNKNLLNLFKALRGVSCHLHIIGHLKSYQLEALKENKIEYSNSVNLSDQQMIEKYQTSDMVTFVSIYEGFGMPIIEANATGRPVITSNIPPMSDVAGNAACLVNPHEVNEIREGILKIIDDASYRDQLEKAGLDNVKRFEPSVIANQYYELYKKIVNS